MVAQRLIYITMYLKRTKNTVIVTHATTNTTELILNRKHTYLQQSHTLFDENNINRPILLKRLRVFVCACAFVAKRASARQRATRARLADATRTTSHASKMASDMYTNSRPVNDQHPNDDERTPRFNPKKIIIVLF